jgi:small-conductance mechanosensitive channel
MVFINLINYQILSEKVLVILPRIFTVVFSLIFAIVLYKLITKGVKEVLYKRARTKQQRNNVIVFMNILKYFFYFIILLVIIFSITGSLTGLGISAGLLTAALGWALQRPITGIAAWIMVITKKPFQIGDRVIIGKVKGDVIDITLTHIYINEIGGTIASEEISGRTIMIPNSILFEKNIINYTLQNEFILDEVITLVTYESNLDKAMKICENAALKIIKPFLKDVEKKPSVRTFFRESGIDVKVRYFVKADERIEIASKITQEIFKQIKRAKDVEIAYPHLEMLYRKKKT